MVNVQRSRSQLQMLPVGNPYQLSARPSDWLRSAARGYFLRRHRLTPRQLEVLELLADGLSAREIALQLTVSVRSVEDHIHDLHTRLGTEHRAELVALWLALVYGVVDGLGLALQPRPADEWLPTTAGHVRATGKEP
jgi:DNA-binding CsgD family transcriptional regulator